MLAHITDTELFGSWLVAAVVVATTALAFVAGRRSARAVPTTAPSTRSLWGRRIAARPVEGDDNT
jgi:hypothetical protein